MSLSIEQISKLQELLREAKAWSTDIEYHETRLTDNSGSCSRSFYREEYERIYQEEQTRLKLIEEIEEMFGV